MNDMGMMGTPSPEKERPAAGGHSIQATDRREIAVHGVREVISFDDTLVRLVTTAGLLNLEGEGLRVHVLNTRDGIVAVTGKLCGLLYEEEPPAGADARASLDRPRGLFGRRRWG